MKRIKYFLPAIFTLLIVQSAISQTVDEIAEKCVAALGGKDKMMVLNSIKMEGSMQVNGFDIGIAVTVLNGKGSRTDISVPGQDAGYRIVTPTRGWNFSPFQGQTEPEETPETVVKASQNSLDLQSPLLNYKAKGNNLELLGNETVAGAPCFKIKLTNKNGTVSTLFIDAKTFLRVKSIITVNVDGTNTEVATTYSDFKKLPEGYTIPFSQTNANGTITFSKIEVNKPVDEGIFTIK